MFIRLCYRMDEIVTNLSKRISSDQQVTLLEDLIICLTFLPSNVVTESINTIYANHHWLSARYHSIAQWLQERSGMSTPTVENDETSTTVTEGGSDRLLASSFAVQVLVILVALF